MLRSNKKYKVAPLPKSLRPKKKSIPQPPVSVAQAKLPRIVATWKDMDFTDAMRAMKGGARVRRHGWNEKDMWICLGAGHAALPADKFWNEHTKNFAVENGGTAEVLPYIIMKTADNKILMGWLASQSDMLASDYEILL